jgi:7-keto-8-aminopelargonate synthetase-like enzyme
MGHSRSSTQGINRKRLPRPILYVLICLDCMLMLIPRIRFRAVLDLVCDVLSSRRPIESLIRFGYFTCRHFYARELTSPVGKYITLEGHDSVFLNAGSYDYMGNGGRCRPEVMTRTEESGYGHASPDIVRQLEASLASFVGKEDAIVCATGYSANANLIQHLTEDKSVFIMDEQTHASMRVASSRRAVVNFKHNDLDDLERLLRIRTGRRQVWVFVEGLYSMAGDFCPLPDLVRMRDRYGFKLYVDEAHSLGAVGPTGRGVCEHFGVSPSEVDVLVGTFSKSFASQGGFLATSGTLAKQLRDRLAAEPDPENPITVPCAAQVLAVLGEGFRTDRLKEITHKLRDGLVREGFSVLGDRDSPVIPVQMTWPSVIVRAMERLTKAKVAVVLVGPPAVEWDQLRLRLCANVSYSEEDIDGLLAAFAGKLNTIARERPVLASSNERDPALATIRRFGVGNCGPFQFYGTSTIHSSFERFLAKHTGYAHVILYPSGYNMLHSVIGLIASRGDALLLPRSARGMLLRAARDSHAHWEHYEPETLSSLVEELRKRHGRIVVLLAPGSEALLPNWVSECGDLPVEFVLAAGGTGTGERVDAAIALAQLRAANRMVHHALLSFEDAFDVTGGAYLTSVDPYDHRIKSKSLVFSASLPLFCVEAVRHRVEQLGNVPS